MEFPNWKGGGGNRDTKTNNTQNTSRNTNLKTVTTHPPYTKIEQKGIMTKA
jgi:hypothetical protein